MFLFILKCHTYISTKNINVPYKLGGYIQPRQSGLWRNSCRFLPKAIARRRGPNKPLIATDLGILDHPWFKKPYFENPLWSRSIIWCKVMQPLLPKAIARGDAQSNPLSPRIRPRIHPKHYLFQPYFDFFTK